MNSTRQNTLRLFLAILTCCLGSGCSKTPGWFIGKYQFDLETTMKGIKNAESKMTSEKKKDDGLVGAANALALALAPIAFAKVYEDTTITISSSEFIAMKGGSGTVLKFEVFEAPSRDRISIKTSKGDIETWVQTENGIAKDTGGDVSIMIHFKRVP